MDELQTAYQIAIGGVVTALCFLAKLQIDKSDECEKDRKELRAAIEELKGEDGESRGKLHAFERCPAPKCPFRGGPITKGFAALEVLVALLFLSSCVSYKDGSTYFGAVGMDASSIEIPGKLIMKKVNMSKSFGKTADIVKAMWDNYLTAMGLRFLAGEYFTLEGAKVGSAQTIELEKLHNAATEAEGKRALEALKLMPPATL